MECKCKKCGKFIDESNITVNIVEGNILDIMLEHDDCGYRAYTFIKIDDLTEDEE